MIWLEEFSIHKYTKTYDGREYRHLIPMRSVIKVGDKVVIRRSSMISKSLWGKHGVVSELSDEVSLFSGRGVTLSVYGRELPFWFREKQLKVLTEN